MLPFFQILLAAGGLALLVAAVWRLSSRHAPVPCPSWLAWMVELDNPFAKRHNAAAIVGRLGLSPGMRVLDAGCGPGRVTIPLARAAGAGGEVVALDIQEAMLARAEAKAKAAGLSNIRFRQGAIEAGSLGSEEFDRVLLVTVLGEVPDREGALREIRRALKPDGILSITEILFDPHFQSRAAILKLASATGLREKTFWGDRLAYTIHLVRSEEMHRGAGPERA